MSGWIPLVVIIIVVVGSRFHLVFTDVDRSETYRLKQRGCDQWNVGVFFGNGDTLVPRQKIFAPGLSVRQAWLSPEDHMGLVLSWERGWERDVNGWWKWGTVRELRGHLILKLYRGREGDIDRRWRRNT